MASVSTPSLAMQMAGGGVCVSISWGGMAFGERMGDPFGLKMCMPLLYRPPSPTTQELTRIAAR